MDVTNGPPVDAQEPSTSNKRPAEPDPAPPRKRRNLVSPFTATQQLDVDNAVKALEPNADITFCVVTHASQDCTVLEYAHVLAADTPHEVFDKLEWLWNMPYSTLDVNTIENVHPLDAAIRGYFDHTDSDDKPDGWFWLPHPDDLGIIKEIYKFYVGVDITAPAPGQYPNVRRKPEEFYENQKSFKYRFTPFPAMKNSWAVRRFAVPTSGLTPETPAVQHYYPFDTLPPISLHIPYHFVICDTGRKLQSVYGDDYKDNKGVLQDHPELDAPELLMITAVRGIYDAWMHAEPVLDDDASPDAVQGLPNTVGSGDGGSHVTSDGTIMDATT
ncbi:hypothetical protein C2E23DRAFT_720575 [Lenzites betulinus]|nr:hypothetical protein C2E23DRAFT_720575 [Lenzites betulinus]